MDTILNVKIHKLKLQDAGIKEYLKGKYEKSHHIEKEIIPKPACRNGGNNFLTYQNSSPICNFPNGREITVGSLEFTTLHQNCCLDPPLKTNMNETISDLPATLHKLSIISSRT